MADIWKRTVTAKSIVALQGGAGAVAKGTEIASFDLSQFPDVRKVIDDLGLTDKLHEATTIRKITEGQLDDMDDADRNALGVPNVEPYTSWKKAKTGAGLNAVGVMAASREAAIYNAIASIAHKYQLDYREMLNSGSTVSAAKAYALAAAKSEAYARLKIIDQKYPQQVGKYVADNFGTKLVKALP